MTKDYSRRVKRVRKKLRKVSRDRYRLTVFKSNKNIYVQIIDDVNNKTLVSSSSLDKLLKKEKLKNKSEISSRIAENLAEKAKSMKINRIYFDRGKYRYHGRIKLIAETLRKKGLNF